MGRNRVHELNREHVAAPIATTMADLRLELWHRMRKELGGWKPKPLYACVFGSAARGDGDADSDVDLLLVHPPFPGEAKQPRKANVIDAVAAFMTAPMPASPAEAARWPRNVDRLRAHVLLWSGNPLQVVDLSFVEWLDRTRNTALIGDIERDGIDLVGSSIPADSAPRIGRCSQNGQGTANRAVWQAGSACAPGDSSGISRSCIHGPRRTVLAMSFSMWPPGWPFSPASPHPMPSVVRAYIAATEATTIGGRPTFSRPPCRTEPSSPRLLLASST